MLHILAVDDEPMAVNYLLDAFEDWNDRDLTMEKAYSGIQAMEKAGGVRIDILLTDIRMPGMNGLELADRVLARWPRCKVIFLTGHNDFEYIQSAIRKGSVDYVLKTEGDEAIFRAIGQAADAIMAELQEAGVLAQARDSLRQALPSLRRDYMLELLRGDADGPDMRGRRFSELEVGLRPDSPVMMAMGRVDDWSRYATGADKSLMMYAVQNIAEELLGRATRFLMVPYDQGRFVWLIQSASADEPSAGGPDREDAAAGRLTAFVRGTAERIQESCRKLLGLPVSLALGGREVPWEEAPRQLGALKLLFAGGLSGSSDMLVMDDGEGEPDARRSSGAYFAVHEFRQRLRKLDLLEQPLDNGDKAQFLQLYDELTRWNGEELPEAKRTLLTLEMFASLSAFFLSYLNGREPAHRFESDELLGKCVNLDAHGSLQQAIDHFRSAGASLAEGNGRLQEERTHELIRRIHQFVSDYLHEDLSLTRLAAVVHLSPPYLSRMYKLLTGQNLLDYIAEARVAKAKRLLKGTAKKIHEIAAEVGIDSAPYFTRLFKKLTDRTPQEYRDSAEH